VENVVAFVVKDHGVFLKDGDVFLKDGHLF
jgi:hypothetical protein